MVGDPRSLWNGVGVAFMERQVIWEASAQRKQSSHMSKFWHYCTTKTSTSFDSWSELHQWSVSNLGPFWELVAEYCSIRWVQEPTNVYAPSISPSQSILGGHWFPDGTLNYAQNLLESVEDLEQTAVISIYEGMDPVVLSFRELTRRVANLATYLTDHGLKPLDRVFGVVGNTWEAIVAMLATARCGAVWASCSPDFGHQGIADRASQIEPTFIIYHTDYRYNSRSFDVESTVAGVARQLPMPPQLIPVHMTDENKQSEVESFRAIIEADTDRPAPYVSVDSEHPLFIMFSSGTTGKPKCIIHGTGNTLIQHKKELMLHCDLHAGEKILFFTTCGWMMWNWQVSALSVGATVVCYEGSPALPSLERLWRELAEHQVQVFGTSPKFLQSCEDAKILCPSQQLGCLKTILSTGSPLMPQHYRWVYESQRLDVHLASICGGTDIIGCFILGNPLTPVRVGEIQGAGLGMAVEAWNQDGVPVYQEKAEMVCTRPFPSMPVGFWNDPDNRIYEGSYFQFFDVQPKIWRHGDFIEMMPSGGVVVHGRSDATLNPQGVRIGTAEIYHVVEALGSVVDSIAVGWKQGDDVRIVLCVQLVSGETWTDQLGDQIKKSIRSSLTPRHVPFRVFQVPGVPYTRSGKKLEMLVTKIINGEEPDNLSAVANPQACEAYRQLARQLAISIRS